MALAPATRLGPYEILQPIGAGGMGEVYRARDTRLERAVAIKILPPHLSSDPIRKQRFEREAKVISSLNHPHICTLYDVGSLSSGFSYLVTELVEGETPREWLKRAPFARALHRGRSPGTGGSRKRRMCTCRIRDVPSKLPLSRHIKARPGLIHAVECGRVCR